ncbi:RNaseH domain-containing protein [Achromobacter xylosoxidans]|uniref:RNaseH domain-containing protein n=1 Tax=Alcaligenes xylosoxydans xylosoxydans TaxID=85698 RepID=UPI0015658C07|nr:RNaseH domain-containing protein [Achromobacter xylosoxidans]QKI70657.1 DUF3893 domain-containing protein [Achromobacter xylosoxidans]
MSDETTATSTSPTPSTVWQRSLETKGSDRPVLLGARLRPEWLGQDVSLLAVRFTRSLLSCLQTLLEVSKSKEDKLLPIVRLRALLMAKFEGIVRLDRDLALKDATKAAFDLRAVGDELFDERSHGELKEEIASILLRWHMDVLAPWAQRNELNDAANAVRQEIIASNIDLQPRRQPMVVCEPGQVNRPQWDLIAKHLAERLVGEELFEGLGPCELVADATSTEGAVELTTWPTKVTGSDTMFSMVARLSVATWPSSRELYLKITPIKRVWAKKVPGRKPNAPPIVRCYVFSPEHPVLPANIRRGKEGWEFGDEYALYQTLPTGRGELPQTIQEAMEQARPTGPTWWVGLPELTTLFDYVQQRTAFESDEVDLRDRVVELLPDVLDPVLPFRLVKIPRTMTQAKSEVARLKVDDVTLGDGLDIGLAGAALGSESPSEEDEEAAEGQGDTGDAKDETNDLKRRARLERHRLTNEAVLQRIHPQHTPSLWVFVDGEDERKLIERSAKAVFGESLRLEVSPLPTGVHGLRADLELAGEKGIVRFDARVQKWKRVAEQIAAGTSGARHVLICAAKDVGNRAEDPVNYFAGLHAMCSYGKANVHHLLPLETDRQTGKPDVQHFIHRVQSALLDLFLAHSGVVFGVQPFVHGCLGANAPKAIYGVQAIRSKARAFTQEQRVSLIVFTRLDTATGATSVSFAYRKSTRVQSTDWQPLNEGLQWLGSQRQLSGDESWLKENFAEITRKALGRICESDPSAVVLLDWSTVAGLWKEISDDALISNRDRGILLDGTDLGKAFPQLTLLRLRADRNATMVMRWVNTSKFDEWRSEPEPSPTRMTFEEQYATTYKTAVALDDDASGGLPHYLVVMGYRNTVQIKRGMSCFRSRTRMSRNKSGWFERRTLPVAKDNAALPSGLEVTVLRAPSTLKSDNLISLVMGLRLGYAHYDDWTALPAPLFFVRKVRDYIVRYPDTADLVVTDGPAVELDASGPDGITPEPSEAPSVLQTELVAEVLEGFPALRAGEESAATQGSYSQDQVAVSNSMAAESAGGTSGESESSATPAISKGGVEGPVTLDDPALQRALEAGLATTVLFVPSSGLVAKQTYESMLLESVRVKVEPPWFVTKETVLPADAWPKDKRAIGYYWKKLARFPIRLRSERGEAPSVANFPDWVMRRLSIPQSAYALDISGLLPVARRIFYRIDEAYGRYLDEANKAENGQRGNNLWKDLPDLVRYLCKGKYDEDLGWILCLVAHHPYKDLLPKVLKAVEPEAMGPYARAGLEYMTTCFNVCRQIYEDRRAGNWKGKSYLVPGIPKPVDVPLALAEVSNASLAVMGTVGATSSTNAAIVPGSATVPAPRHAPQASAAVEMLQEASDTSPAPVLAEAPDAPSSPPHPKWPTPGSAVFEEELIACHAHLEELRASHKQYEEARAARRQAELLAEQQRQAEQTAAAAAREAWRHKLDALTDHARRAIEALSPDLEVGEWHTVRADTVLGAAPEDAAYETALAQVNEALEAVSHATSASQALLCIDAGNFEGALELSAKERARRRQALLAQAITDSTEAEDRLKVALQTCPLFVQGPGEPSSCAPRVFAEQPSDTPKQSSPATFPVPPEPALPATTEGVVVSAAIVASQVDPELGIPKERERDEKPSAPLPLQPADSTSSSENEPATASAHFEDSSPPDIEEVVKAPALGPRSLAEPAQSTFVECLQGRYWALASAQSLVLSEILPGPATRLWGTVPGFLRGADTKTPLDTDALTELEQWLADAQASQSAPHSFPQYLGVLGASLLPMLLPGRTSSVRWAAIDYLRPRLQQHTELSAVIERIATLDTIQLALTPEILSAAKVSLQQALLDGVARMRRRAQNWLTDSELVTTWAATDYIEMHAAICSDKRGFATGLCIAAIARGDDATVRSLLPEVQKLAGKGLATITDLRRQIGRRRPIEGVGRDYLVQNLKTTASFATEFVELLDKQRASKHASLPPKHQEFLSSLYRELKVAVNYVVELGLSDDTAAVHKQVLLSALHGAIGLMEQQPGEPTVSEEEQALLLRYPLARDLKPVLTWSPNNDVGNRVSLGEAGQLHAAVAHAIRELRRETSSEGKGTPLQRLLHEAASEHRDVERLIPARIIAERLDKQGRPLPATWTQITDQVYREARNKFKLDLQEAQQLVTNALSLSALPQTEAGRMLKVLESLIRANNAQEIGASPKAGGLYPDYPHARAMLHAVVLRPLEAKIEQSRQKLRLEIEEFVQSQTERKLDPIVRRQLEQQKSSILASLDRGTALSVRVARSEFQLLREGKLPLLRFEGRRAGIAFEEFRQDLRRLTRGHRVLDGLCGVLKGEYSVQGPQPDWLAAMGESERAEALEFLSQWQEIFRPNGKEEVAKALKKFLHDAGVSEEPTILTPNDGLFFLEGKPFAGLAASGFGVYIPPALGSLATHIQGVIVPQHFNTQERLGQRVAQLSTNTPTFFLCRQGLTPQQRAQLGSEHQLLLLDDDLVAYLTAHPAQRLAKLLEVCLLSFRTNPYDDYGARPVPPEMFFGRTQEISDLRNVPSAAVLYGGRRLGKSSLLNQILEESKTHLQAAPDGKTVGELAVYVPLDSGKDPAGFSQNYRLFAWRSIHKALVTAGFLELCATDLKTDQEIRERIQDEIVAGRCKTKACYLLIDEADDVMRQDLQDNAPFLASLQALSDSILSHARVRYVIAGLHNLTRMTTGGNTALGKARSIALQPFSSGTDILNGVDLITKPLAAMGFHFERGDEGLPMRIMAVCNFYPAFIQLYCRNLMNRLYNNRAGKELTISITSEDLDAVERDEAFLQEIREKFSLNLNLDKRYKAIALILAEHSYAEPAESVFEGLTATEIRDSCVAYAPSHFKSTAPGAYEALLDEMDKLTILERNGSRYQLRTPDIATMLGDQEQVSHLLEELSRETPTEDRSHGEARLPVVHKTDAKTFPLPSAWVRNFLRSTPGDLVLLVGNQLSGISGLEKLRNTWEVSEEDAALEVLRNVSTSEDARNHFLGMRRKPFQNKTRLILIPPKGWQPDHVEAYAALAQDQGRLALQGEAAGRSRLPTIRPVLLASPGQAMTLAQRITSSFKPLPKNVLVTPIPAWSDDAVYFRFNETQHENLPVRDSAAARAALLQASCGFGEELQNIAGYTLTVTEALELPDEARKRLTPDLQTFYSRIGVLGCMDNKLLAMEAMLMSLHGCKRDESKELDLAASHELDESHLLFAKWMGLVNLDSNDVWDVPALYLDLLLERS